MVERLSNRLDDKTALIEPLQWIRRLNIVGKWEEIRYGNLDN